VAGNFSSSLLPGCFLVENYSSNDNRGSFEKIFNIKNFEAKGLSCSWAEQYYSISNKNVLRGMHFQVPPYQHQKLVTCISGKILDVVFDLRAESEAYGKYDYFELSDKFSTSIYVPEGVAHGFLTLSDKAVVLYNVTSIHSTEHDAGISWDSIGFDWPILNPVLSERDRGLPRFGDYCSPFRNRIND
jgi:dTDP-4-dehydrorhamnose 3,5-epimerase